MTTASMAPSGVQFKEGMSMDIYSNAMLNIGWQGSANLIKRKRLGMSFIKYDEKLFTRQEEKASSSDGNNHQGHIPLTKEENERNRKYALMHKYLIGNSSSDHVHIDLHKLHKKLQSLVSRELDSLRKINNLLQGHRTLWKGTIDERKRFFNLFNNDEILRFSQQIKFGKKWNYTVWREERWLVEFQPQCCIASKETLYNTVFRTHRNIVRPVLISPKDDAQVCEMVRHTTNASGVSNYDKAVNRQRIVEETHVDEQYHATNDTLDMIEATHVSDNEPDKNTIKKIENLYNEIIENSHKQD